MPRVTGIGGVFFKAKGDAKALAAWYAEHLGIRLSPWGGAVFHWAEDAGAADAATAWNIDDAGAQRYQGSASGFMINYRVVDLPAMVERLRASGTRILGEPAVSEYGTFASFADPDGNTVELWEPPAAPAD
jgi:predicted enzyme related to lactoylglutathione lyase